MTAIRNTQTGQWTYPEKSDRPRRESPEFVRLVTGSVNGQYRTEQIIHIPSITQIREGAFGHYIHIRDNREPVPIEESEYIELTNVLANRTVTLGAKDTDV